MGIWEAIASFVDWLRDLLGLDGQASQPTPVKREAESSPRVRHASQPATGGLPTPQAEPSLPAPSEAAEAYLERVRDKLDKLAEDFNAGAINRVQFRSLYAHYQREIQGVEKMIETAPASEEWKAAVTEGQSLIIRRQHIARAKGYAIFENDSGMPVSTLGRFELDPALLVPMLSSYRAAAREIFGAGTRSTEMDDGRWLCFVPGEFTTMLAVFTAEPAGKQLDFLQELHRHFEQANRRHLSQPPLDANVLLYPHEYYLGQWRRE